MESLEKYQKGDLVVPGDLVKELDIPIIEVYHRLEEQRKKGILDIEYVPNCPHCKHLEDRGYPTINSIPEPLFCKGCNKELENVLESTLVFYKKL